MAAILSPLGLYGGNRESKIPFSNNLKLSPSDRNLLSLDASLVIPTRVLRFEDSGVLRPKPVRPPRPIFGLGFVAQPSNPVIFW
jgi:hypothetical protein